MLLKVDSQVTANDGSQEGEKLLQFMMSKGLYIRIPMDFSLNKTFNTNTDPSNVITVDDVVKKTF